MSDLLDDLGFRPEPPPTPRKQRPWLGWLVFGGAGSATIGVAIALIVSGLNVPPAPAPLPDHVFAQSGDSVPDPVTGAIPKIGAPVPSNKVGPDEVAVIAQHNGSTVGAAANGGANNNGPGAGSDAASPDDVSGRDGSRQVPTSPLQNDRLVIPAIGVDTSVEISPIVDGSLVLPHDVSRVTEWEGSAPLGASTGTVLVAGHVDNVNQGRGALYWIHTLQPGDAIYLTGDGIVTRWKVVAMQQFIKAQLPADLFIGSTGARRLVLVTCGGDVVHDAQGRGSYTDNVVVTAVQF
ncbi:MAG: class F sortase [Actinomycetota bacterium]|nr:class F sortase [Actinomycetota bacterium]